MIHTQYGVTYQQESILDDKDERYPWVGFRVFKYRYRHIPTGGRGTSELACRSDHDLLRLLNGWNHCTDWVYTSSIA